MGGGTVYIGLPVYYIKQCSFLIFACRNNGRWQLCSSFLSCTRIDPLKIFYNYWMKNALTLRRNSILISKINLVKLREQMTQKFWWCNLLLPAPVDKSRRSSQQSTSSGFHSEDSSAPKTTSPMVTDSVMRKSSRSKTSRSGSQSQSSESLNWDFETFLFRHPLFSFPCFL